jgi:hypothetical protein
MALFSPEERDYYWWRCEELTCPRRGEPPAYLPLLKVHLKVLFEKAAAGLERVGGLSASQQEQCRAKLASIFRDKTATITSLNIKSLQCSALFTEILELQGQLPDPTFSKYRGGTDPINLYTEIKKKPSVLYTFDGMKEFLKSNSIWRDFLHDEEEGGALCCPNLRNKNICFLLGELTVEEIVRTYAKQIYICGLTFDMAYADGFHYPPLLFLHHDYVHARNRRSQVSGLYAIGYRRLEQFVEYLDSPNALTQPEKKACFLILFMTSHESGREDLYAKLPLQQLVGQGYVTWDGPRWRNKNDLGGLLIWYMGEGSADSLMAAPDGTIQSVLKGAGAILSEKWNAFFAGEGAADPEPSAGLSRGPGPGAFNARAEGNAAAWNALGFAPAVVKDPGLQLHGLEEGEWVTFLDMGRPRDHGKILSMRKGVADTIIVTFQNDLEKTYDIHFSSKRWGLTELKRDTRPEATILESVEAVRAANRAKKQAEAARKKRIKNILAGPPIPEVNIQNYVGQSVYGNVIVEGYGGETSEKLEGTLRAEEYTENKGETRIIFRLEDEYGEIRDFDDPLQIWVIPAEGGGRRRRRTLKKRGLKAKKAHRTRSKTKKGVRGRR